MDLLTDQLRAAAADPPPSRIDIDALLAGERHRRQRIAVGGVAAAVLALAVAVPLILGYPGPPGGSSLVGASPPVAASPSAGVSPPAGAPQDAEAARLTGIFAGWLRATLPAATRTDPNAPGSPAPWFLGEAGQYKAGVDAADAAGLGHIFAMVLADLPPCTTEPCETGPECPAPEIDGTYCELRPDGTKVFVVSMDNAGMINHQVAIYAPDGTLAQISASNFGLAPDVDPTASAGGMTIRCSTTEPKKCDGTPPLDITRPTPPLTVAQLIEIGLELAA